MGQKLDETFWSKFSKDIWERKTLAVKDLESSLRTLDELQVFELLVRFADQCRKAHDPSGFKLFLEGQRLFDDAEVLELLPLRKDKSLQGYHKRMDKLFPDYCLVCDELLQVSGDKQHILSEFTNALFSKVGFPNRFVEMGLYLGNYRKTPFGIHVDGCGVFSFPIVGTKIFRIWKPEFVRKNPEMDRAFEYARFKKNSEVLTASPGDMTYWPSSAWHIAESDGSFSATWSLGVWVDKTHREMFTEILAQFVGQNLGAQAQKSSVLPSPLFRETGEISALPEEFQNSLKDLKALTHQQLERAFQKSWMQHVSKQGFKLLESRPAPLSAKISLRTKSLPILWMKTSEGITLGFQGMLIETESSSKLLKLIQDLNSGKSCAPLKILKGEASKKDIAVLRGLAAAGAFRS